MQKAEAGLLIQASKKWNIDFSKSFMIGDRWKDISAGKKVGCKTIFINNNYKLDKKVKEDFIISEKDLINDQFILLQRGKKKYFILNVE